MFWISSCFNTRASVALSAFSGLPPAPSTSWKLESRASIAVNAAESPSTMNSSRSCGFACGAAASADGNVLPFATFFTSASCLTVAANSSRPLFITWARLMMAFATLVFFLKYASKIGCMISATSVSTRDASLSFTCEVNCAPCIRQSNMPVRPISKSELLYPESPFFLPFLAFFSLP
ncbi:hypothetical protein D3C87_1467460 [compost metagenome]